MRSTYLAAVCVSLFACTVEAPDTSVTNQAATAKNRLASNRLASNRLASNRLASNRLASNSLSSIALNANPDTSDILQTADGRDVYSYVVSCALPEGTTISADVPGAADTAPPDSNYTCSSGHCTFVGAIGLAPHWADHKLDNKGAGWVSACVLSRCNANGLAESISMRGRANALVVGGDELTLYSAEEGAFYGDVFDAGAASACDAGDTACQDAENAAWLLSHANACRGANNDVAHSQARDCATDSSYCGFNVVGDCRNFDSFSNPVACAGYTGADGYYTDCHDVLSNSNGKWKPHNAPFREVITTYVAN